MRLLNEEEHFLSGTKKRLRVTLRRSKSGLDAVGRVTAAPER